MIGSILSTSPSHWWRRTSGWPHGCRCTPEPEGLGSGHSPNSPPPTSHSLPAPFRAGRRRILQTHRFLLDGRSRRDRHTCMPWGGPRRPTGEPPAESLPTLTQPRLQPLGLGKLSPPAGEACHLTLVWPPGQWPLRAHQGYM